MADPAPATSPPAKSPSPAKSPKSPAKSPSPVRSPANPASSPIQDTTPLVVDDNPEEGDDLGIEVGAESDTTSLKSSILRYREENGRTYHAYKDGAYVLPNDDAENERLDLQHTLFLITFDDRLHVAPMKKEPYRVLDAGCGTGIWAIEYADDHPDAQVTGIDLSPIQPAFVPPNALFYIDDLEDNWEFSTPFDFIFARFLTGSIQDWPRFFKQSYDNLSPGGTIEVQDIVCDIFCDDKTLSEDCDLKRWLKLLEQAFNNIGRSVNSAYEYGKQLSEAGFVDVVTIQEKWPTNRWPRDKKYKQIGIWAQENMTAGLGAMSLAIFTRPITESGLGWSREEAEVLLAGVRKDMRNTSIHGYWKIFAVHARKPETTA